MKNAFRGFAFLFLAASLGFAQKMPVERAIATPARTGNQVCAGASGTVAMTPTMVSTIAVSVQSGALTCTTPTAVQLCALFSSSGYTNLHWDSYFVNGGTGTVTVALGTGVTNTAYTNIYTVAAGSVRHFLYVLSNCTAGSEAAQILSLGTSVF
jgi:hypothetical protein